MSVERTSPVNWLKTYWFIFVFLVVTGVAWGESKVKITTLEEAVKQQVETQREVSKLDERTQMMLDEQKEQRKILLEILKQSKNNGDSK